MQRTGSIRPPNEKALRQVTDTLYALLAIAMVLTVVSILVPLAERFRLPHTVLLAIAGMGLGFFGSWIVSGDIKLGVLGDAFVGLDKLEVGTEFFLPLFLPPLLFTAGLTIDVRRLMDEIHAVLLLAIVAVLVCIACVAGVVHLATGIDIVVCLLLGAVVSTTDPAAVIGIFRDVGAPKRLSILAEGESLLNDAVAIAAFGLFMGILVARASADPSAAMPGDPTSAIGVFLREFIGGLALGFIMARVAMMILSRLGESDAAIASVTVSLSYLCFIFADRYLHVSGVVAVVMAALTVAAYGPTHLHPRQWSALRQIWAQLEFWANCLIFVLASMLAADVLLKISWLYVGGVMGNSCSKFSGLDCHSVHHSARLSFENHAPTHLECIVDSLFCQIFWHVFTPYRRCRTFWKMGGQSLSITAAYHNSRRGRSYDSSFRVFDEIGFGRGGYNGRGIYLWYHFGSARLPHSPRSGSS